MHPDIAYPLSCVLHKPEITDHSHPSVARNYLPWNCTPKLHAHLTHQLDTYRNTYRLSVLPQKPDTLTRHSSVSVSRPKTPCGKPQRPHQLKSIDEIPSSNYLAWNSTSKHRAHPTASLMHHKRTHLLSELPENPDTVIGQYV